MWFVYAILASALWGFEYALVGRVLDGKFTPVFLVSLQMLVGALILGAYSMTSGAFLQEAREAFSDRQTLGLIGLSTLVFTFGNLMIAASIQEGNAVVAGFVEITYPLFIILISLALGWGNQIGWRTILGGIIILAGVMILQTDQVS